MVFNEVDLSAAPPLSSLPVPFPIAAVSALHGTGLEGLQACISEMAESFRTDTGEDLIAINARHAGALNEAKSCLEHAASMIRNGNPIELIASELRSTLTSFGQISGKVDHERVLDQLFAAFCIGK